MRTEHIFSIVGLAGGLLSIKDVSAQAYAHRLLNDCPLAPVANHESQFIKFISGLKLIHYMNGLRDYLSPLDLTDLWAVYDLRKTVAKRVQVELDPAYDVLLNAGIDVFAYKGTDLLHGYGHVDGERFIVDIDPLVQGAERAAADLALKKAGYFQAYINRRQIDPATDTLATSQIDKKDIDWVIENHHEAHPYFKVIELQEIASQTDLIAKYTNLIVVDDRVFALPMIDLHWSIASGFDDADIWAKKGRTVSLSSGTTLYGCPHEINICLYLGRAFSVTHTLNAPMISAFVDGCRVISQASDVDWDYVVYISEKYRLFAGTYYGLRRIDTIIPNKIPIETIQKLEETLFYNREYDLGDFYPKLLSYFPDPASEFSGIADQPFKTTADETVGAAQ